MKKLLSLLVAAAFFYACNPTNDELAIEPIQPIEQEIELVPKEKIDQFIINSLQKNNEFKWSELNDVMLWSALMHADSILTVGYTAENLDIQSRQIVEIDVNEATWQRSKAEILDETSEVISYKSGKNVKPEDIPSYTHEVLPFVEMKVSYLEVISRLRSMDNVRYVEPLGYKVDFETYGDGERLSDSGCTNDPRWNYNLFSHLRVPQLEPTGTEFLISI